MKIAIVNQKGGAEVKIAIVNQKGGSGKSTTAVLLTKAFAAEKGPENKKAVLLVDADPQAGSTVLFDAKHQPNLVDAMIGNKVTEDQIIQKRIQSKKNDPGYWINLLGSDHRLDKVFTSVDPFAFQRILKGIEYETIIIDTPPMLAGITGAAIQYADRIIVPAELSETALDPTIYTVQTILERNKQPEVMILGYKGSPELHSGTEGKLATRFIEAIGKYVIGSLPRSKTAANTATLYGHWTAKTIESIQQPLLDLFGGEV